jgi:hypothetical protein
MSDLDEMQPPAKRPRRDTIMESNFIPRHIIDVPEASPKLATPSPSEGTAGITGTQTQSPAKSSVSAEAYLSMIDWEEQNQDNHTIYSPDKQWDQPPLSEFINWPAADPQDSSSFIQYPNYQEASLENRDISLPGIEQESSSLVLPADNINVSSCETVPLLADAGKEYVEEGTMTVCFGMVSICIMISCSCVLR